MNANKHAILFCVRIGVSVPLLILGFHLFSSVSDINGKGLFYVLAGILLVVFPSIIIAPPIARLIGVVTGGLFFPAHGNDPSPPARSIARAQRAKGNFQAALREYEVVLKLHPQDLQSYIDMIDIAKNEMANRPLAERIAKRALSTIKSKMDRAAIEKWMK